MSIRFPPLLRGSYLCLLAEVALEHRGIAHDLVGRAARDDLRRDAARTMCCASAITARITCSMSRMVRPSARLSSRNTSTIWSHSVGRRPAITSSSSSSCGRVASARATSRRLRSGSVSDGGGQLALSRRGRACRRSRRRARRAEGTSLDRCSAPTITLSSTDSPAKGLTIWNVRPMPAAHTWSGRSPCDAAGPGTRSCPRPAHTRRRPC